MNVFWQHNDVHCGPQSGEEADPAPETVMEQSSFFLSLKSLRFQICLQDEQASAFCCSFKFFRFQKEKVRASARRPTGHRTGTAASCCRYLLCLHLQMDTWTILNRSARQKPDKYHRYVEFFTCGSPANTKWPHQMFALPTASVGQSRYQISTCHFFKQMTWERLIISLPEKKESKEHQHGGKQKRRGTCLIFWHTSCFVFSPSLSFECVCPTRCLKKEKEKCSCVDRLVNGCGHRGAASRLSFFFCQEGQCAMVADVQSPVPTAIHPVSHQQHQ